MNQAVRPQPTPIRIAPSACPHDCPSTCALEIEVLDAHTIGRVRGAEDNSYTAGVICAKVARYAERVHHPGPADAAADPHAARRARAPSSRSRGTTALDLIAEKFLDAEARYGAEAVWPYYYAGTMGLVHARRHPPAAPRQEIFRLPHHHLHQRAPTPALPPAPARSPGSDPREMAKSDLVVIWGTNPVNTQVNVMTHATRARKERGAKIVAVDVYMNGTMEQADLAVLVKPGTDGGAGLRGDALPVPRRQGRLGLSREIHRLRRASWKRICRQPHARNGRRRSPAVRSATIEEFARLVGATKRAFFRLGYGFARSRNGAGQHACGALHPGDHRRVAARGWRRASTTTPTSTTGTSR